VATVYAKVCLQKLVMWCIASPIDEWTNMIKKYKVYTLHGTTVAMK
jgi:hypothetical protein